jgi:hypothetical protein
MASSIAVGRRESLVRIRIVGTVLLAVLLFALGSCSQPGGTAPSMPPGALDGFRQAAQSAGYPAEAIEVMANAVHLRVLVRDAKLAQADQATRESAATAIVAAIEQSAQTAMSLPSIQEISVAIVHASDGMGGKDESHVEDVLQFRRGPAGRFALHIT